MNTKYKTEFSGLAKNLAEEGLSDIQISKKLGIATSTYYEYQLKYPEFSEAIRAGKRPVDIEVENALLKRALGYNFVEDHSEKIIDKQSGKVTSTKERKVKRHIPGDVRAQEFWLINRFSEQWRNTQHIDHTTKGNSINQGLPVVTQFVVRKNKVE